MELKESSLGGREPGLCSDLLSELPHRYVQKRSSSSDVTAPAGSTSKVCIPHFPWINIKSRVNKICRWCDVSWAYMRPRIMYRGSEADKVLSH